MTAAALFQYALNAGLKSGALPDMVVHRTPNVYHLPVMSELHIVHPQKPHAHEELALIALRLTPYHSGPQLYTLLAVGGENERPLTADGSIVFFRSPEHAEAALKLDATMSKLGSPPAEVASACDVAEALYLVNSQDADPQGTILDCLLILDDLVRASRLHMPERYQGILTELAARLMEGQQLKQIFSNASLRNHVEDALLWCVGAIVVKARVVVL
jgi:hypothetical protein